MAWQDARAAIVIRQMNDLLIQEGGALIPLVYRSAAASPPTANSLGGVDMNGWDSEMWNVRRLVSRRYVIGCDS